MIRRNVWLTRQTYTDKASCGSLSSPTQKRPLWSIVSDALMSPWNNQQRMHSLIDLETAVPQLYQRLEVIHL